jgi:hypothetical protein
VHAGNNNIALYVSLLVAMGCPVPFQSGCVLEHSRSNQTRLSDVQTTRSVSTALFGVEIITI